MLRVTQQANPQAAKRYYSAADYLTEGQERVGLWGGRGAERLGLEGAVDQRSFDRLCENRDPRTGERLTARTRGDRTVLYDFTFSVPKSISLLHGLSGDPEVLAAFRSAVDETMRDVEADMKVRVRKGGRDEDRVSGNMVWAAFVHSTSRPVDGFPDPGLHAHVCVLNASYCAAEKAWKAGQFRDLKRDAPFFEAAFRVRLDNRLRALGFPTVRTGKGFELAGLDDPALLKKFSRRTAEIEAKAKELGITDPERKAELGAKTRGRKNNRLSRTALRTEWDGRLTQGERDAVARVHRREGTAGPPERGERASVDYALEHVFTRKAVADERELLTQALRRGLGSVTVEGVQSELAGRPLVRATQDGRVLATTPAVLAEEQAILKLARGGRGRYRPLGDPARPFARDWLNADQKAAVRHVLGSRDGVILVRGAAGTGKTTLEQELGDALAAAGTPVVAIAPSAAASRGVLREEANFPTADTVARFLVDTKMQHQARNGVVLLDEASLLGSTDTLALLRTARELGARLVMLGDRRQHRAVARGQPLKLLETEAGLPVVEVKEILRQTGEYKQAARALADGRPDRAFALLDRLGWVREMPDGERYRAITEGYLATVRERKKDGRPKTALCVTATWAEANQMAQAIRQELKAAGKLTGERTLAAWVPAHLTGPEKQDAAGTIRPGDLLVFHQHAPGIKNGTRVVVDENVRPPAEYADRFEVYRPASVTLAVGDRVRVTANGRARGGQRLDNGALYTVQAFTRGGDVVLDNGWTVPAAGGVHLGQGIAVTTQTGQGRTVDRVFAGLSHQSLPATTQRTAYVGLTRGREQVLVYTDDRAALLKAVRRADDPLSATELARAAGRHRFRQRLQHHLAGLRRRMSLGPVVRGRSPDRHPAVPVRREAGR